MLIIVAFYISRSVLNNALCAYGGDAIAKGLCASIPVRIDFWSSFEVEFESNNVRNKFIIVLSKTMYARVLA